MNGSLCRIRAMFLRFLYLHKRSSARLLEIILWPVMSLLVWGFTMLYLQTLAPDTASKILCALLNAVIFWDILYRSQLLVTVSLTEEIGSQNLLNLLISPIRGWEWAVAIFLYGLTKTFVIVSLLAGLALLLYNFDLVGQMGFFLPLLALNLVFFGWILGIFTCALVIRWGRSADALIWGIPFLIQPLSAIYYPVSILPEPLQCVSKLFPSTYVFEGMRLILKTGTMPFQYTAIGLALNGIYFLSGILFFRWMYRRAFVTGRLLRFGTE